MSLGGKLANDQVSVIHSRSKGFFKLEEGKREHHKHPGQLGARALIALHLQISEICICLFASS